MVLVLVLVLEASLGVSLSLARVEEKAHGLPLFSLLVVESIGGRHKRGDGMA